MNKQYLSGKNILMSVSDKSHITELAQFLSNHGATIYASGGTREHLLKNNIEVLEAGLLTKTPEAFHGRMKTLSFPIFSGILFRREASEDWGTVKELNITPIDMVVVNLYPFPADFNGETELPIDLIDIGGPCLIRAAAKNHSAVTVLTHPEQYAVVIEEMKKAQDIPSFQLRKQLAKEAFMLTLEYDQRIVKAFQWESKERSSLRYGENPHQKASIEKRKGYGVGAGRILQGKEMSYNNFLDADAAWLTCCELSLLNQQYAASVIVKHGNPCGAAIDLDITKAYDLALCGDPVSAFGGIVAINRTVEVTMAKKLVQVFYEIILAPHFTEEAKEIFASKKNLRLVELDLYDKHVMDELKQSPIVKTLVGCNLYGDRDLSLYKNIKVVSNTNPHSTYLLNPDQMEESLLVQFGTVLVRAIKSNAIVLARASKEGSVMMLGMGTGNPNRLLSMREAIMGAEETEKRLAPEASSKDLRDQWVVFSDAFFPFTDGPKLCLENGIGHIVAPSGSIKDSEVIKFCEDNKQNLYFLDQRHFNH